MTWVYKSSKNFPAMYVNALRAAARTPNEKLCIGLYKKASEARSVAEKFRHFRWCIRQEPQSELERILEAYEIRTQITNEVWNTGLYLTAKPKKLSEFERLNPDLARELGNEID